MNPVNELIQDIENLFAEEELAPIRTTITRAKGYIEGLTQ